MNNSEISRAFNAIVAQLGRDKLADILMNWNESELNEAGDRIIGYPGRDRQFSHGNTGGKVTIAKADLLAWLASNGPVDPVIYGAKIVSDTQWTELITAARAAAGIAAPTNANASPVAESVNTADEDFQGLLRDRGEAIQSRQDAIRRWDAGQRIFAFHEMDEEPNEVTSLDMLNAYTPDQLLALTIEEQTDLPTPSPAN